MDNSLLKLHKNPKTVLTTKDIALIWQETNQYNLNSKIAYYVKQGKLIRLKPGVFAKNKDYNPKELGTSLYSPSYISFETVLRESGVIFQHYETIFLASYTARKIKCGHFTFIYRKLKNQALYNPAGIINQIGFAIANRERAFLDMIYLFKDYYFDNLKSLNWNQCFDIVRIYKNKQLIKRLDKYYKNYV